MNLSLLIRDKVFLFFHIFFTFFMGGGGASKTPPFSITIKGESHDNNAGDKPN